MRVIYMKNPQSSVQSSNHRPKWFALLRNTNTRIRRSRQGQRVTEALNPRIAASIPLDDTGSTNRRSQSRELAARADDARCRRRNGGVSEAREVAQRQAQRRCAAREEHAKRREVNAPARVDPGMRTTRCQRPWRVAQKMSARKSQARSGSSNGTSAVQRAGAIWVKPPAV